MMSIHSPSHKNSLILHHNIYDPATTLHQLVHLSSTILKTSYSRQERIAMFQTIESFTHKTAQYLLCDPIQLSQEQEETIEIPHDVMVSPPHAFFQLSDTGRIHLPLMDWTSFRGYSIVFWLYVEEMSGTRPIFELFRCSTNSNTIGVSASLEVVDKGQVSLSMMTYLPTTTTPTMMITHPITLKQGTWHMLTICHSLPYVKKSKVTCYLDTSLQFQEELAYPSSLVNASKCTIGGGCGMSIRLANVTMYEEEISKKVIETIFTHGPSVYPFRRWTTVPIGAMAQHFGDVRDTTVLSPLVLPLLHERTLAALSKLHVLFSFSAFDVVEESFPDLAIEWLGEGIMNGNGKWITLEPITSSTSSELQQRTAKLDATVVKRWFVDTKGVWNRENGIEKIPIVLDAILRAYTLLGPDEELDKMVSHIVMNLLWIIKGLLLNAVETMQWTLRYYVLHQVMHALRTQEPQCIITVWTPSCIVVCVEVIKSFFLMLPTPPQLHPMQPSVWSWNPLVASGIRAWLMDFRLWSCLSLKTQSMYIHQLYSVACEFPKVFNDLNTIPRLIEILNEFYTCSRGEEVPAWKQECIRTIVEIMEVCLVHQSVQVYEVLEQELTETTFARASGTTSTAPSVTTPTPGVSTTTTQSGGNGGNSNTPLTTSNMSFERRKGGVFFINLENIIWSDQSNDKASTSSSNSPVQHVQVRFALLRDIRAILRFLVASEDTMICHALLLLFRRLSPVYIDIRFALMSSGMIDVLLYLTYVRRPTTVSMTCIPLFIYLLDWLESIEGRTVWCGVEEHLRSIVHAQGHYTRGFLELMMEFYFDPCWYTGIQQSILMNDPSKNDSVLFPISSVETKKPWRQESGIVVVDDGLRDGLEGENGGLTAWIKLATTFSGKRVSLSWEKRVQVVRMASLRHLIASMSHVPSPSSSPATLTRLRSTSETKAGHMIANMFEEGVSGILSLPLKGILPFLPLLLRPTSAPFREKVLMEINVKLKTDEELQRQILLMKKEWAEALLELSLACFVEEEGEEQEEEEEEVYTTRRGAYSFDANKTSEDLVVDNMVSLLTAAMQQPRGWRSFADLVVALKILQHKYHQPSQPSFTLPPTVTSPNVLEHSELLVHPLDWLSRLTGIVIQRMSRSRTMLSKSVAENVHKVLFLVQESLLATPHRCKPSQERFHNLAIWSDSQIFLLTAVLDMCARLVESTHKLYRVGLAPGLHILLHVLAFLDDEALVERITVVLEAFFQQEMNVASAVRVYDTRPPRQVLLSALVCLRRALLVQQPSQTGIIEALRMLTLKVCMSGLFLEELHSAGLDLHVLGDLSDANAVAAVLDALGILINDAEMHEREEEAELVPHFPTAKELRQFVQTVKVLGDEDGTNPTIRHADEHERSLWAALEVEENRMIETCREMVAREKQYLGALRECTLPQREAWMGRFWKTQIHRFHSQHLVTTRDSDVESRIGVYETPAPARMRRVLETNYAPVDLREPFVLTKRGQAVSIPPAPTSTPSGAKSEPQLSPRRRKFSLPLEIHKFDSTVPSPQSHLSLLTPSESELAEDKLLLERVGRVVAEQQGGEIPDITMDVTGNSVAPGGERSANQEDEGGNSSPKREGPETRDIEPISSEGQQEHALSDDFVEVHEREATHADISTHLPSTLWHFDSERHKESGLDPGEGIALINGESILAQAKCRRVIPEGMVTGSLYFCQKYLVFVPLQPDLVHSQEANGMGVDDVAPGLRRCWRWRYTYVTAVYLRRFRLRDSALEIFLRNGTTHFLDFPHVVRQQRNELARLLYSFLPRHVPKQWPPQSINSSGTTSTSHSSMSGLQARLTATTKAWQSRQISNYDYLMALNTFAGRSFNDLTQYPIFPWVLSNYTDPILDLSDTKNFRDLSKPMGALNAARLDEYWERYHSFDDPVIPKFLYGSHYSTCAGVVLFFLFRLQPFADLHWKMQGQGFDLPDRLFHSIQETWEMCNSQMSEVKELTPEFYSDASFLKNLNHFGLGQRHDKSQVNHVVLPPWAKESPEEFIRIHRAALESEYVSRHLHEWIDLIFGFKQRGKAALQANNVFYYLTYYGVVDLDRIEDVHLRESMELQIAHFGQCPMQLFPTSPHPKRNPSLLAHTTGRLRSLSFTRSITPTGNEVDSSIDVIPTAPSSSGHRSPSSSVGMPIHESKSVLRGNGINVIPSHGITRPIVSMFQDMSHRAQEERRLWSPSIDVKTHSKSSIRWLKLFPDRFLTVNDLGVIELYYWKLTPKPQPIGPSKSGTMAPNPDSVVDDHHIENSPGLELVLPTRIQEHVPQEVESSQINIGSGSSSFSSAPIVSSAEDSQESGLEDVLIPTVVEASVHDSSTFSSTCPWLFEVGRDDSPFDFVPRVPVFGTSHDMLKDCFPIVSSSNGRVLITGGAKNGSIQLRLIDLDNGHVIAKASVTGHEAAVTCLSIDRFTYNTQDSDEMMVSGSKDRTLNVWRLSRVKPDLLFRPPRVSSCPLMTLRGHTEPIIDCAVNTYLNAIASCSAAECLVHFLHDDGEVGFRVKRPKIHNNYAFHGVQLSSKGFVVALLQMPSSQDEASCIVIYNLVGVLLRYHEFMNETISHVQLSMEGDALFLTVQPGIIRICRLEDLVTMQEYKTPSSTTLTTAPISSAAFGPNEAVIVILTGHTDGSMVLHLLPDADGSVSFLSNLRRLFGVNAKLKMVKGTVQQAQTLAWTTIGNAKAVTSTARDIAGEALGEAKSMVEGFMSYLRRHQSS